MRVKNYFLLGLLAMLATACKKSGTKIDTDIYIVGGVTSATTGKLMAACWKNGVLTKLSPDTNINYFVRGIAVDGTNVYVVGRKDNYIATYWKNGKEIPLMLPDSATFSLAEGIAVNSNGGVYVAGYIGGSKGGSAVYWTDSGNGMTPINLPSDGFSIAYGVAVNATGVYFAGGAHSLKKPTVSYISTYWTSSEPHLATDSSHGLAYAIALNGSDDVYTAGYTVPGGVETATYWKNGDPTPLSAGVAKAIAIKDGIAYTAGNYTDPVSKKDVAACWKGKERITLSLGDVNNNANLDAYANGIALVGIDVYVVGSTYDPYSYKNVAVYWENGRIKTLPQGVYTDGIVIIPHLH